MNRIIVFASLLLSVFVVHAQIINPKFPLTVNVNLSRFYFPADSGYVEVYYAVHPDNVTLEKINDTLKGTIILQMRLLNVQNGTLFVNSTVSVPIIVSDTASFQPSCVWKFTYSLPYGSYELLSRSYDKLNPNRIDSTRNKFTLKSHNNQTAISDIDICSSIVESADKSSIFYKNSYVVIQNPGLLFGGKIAPVIYHYSELYNLNKDSIYSILTRLEDANGNIVKQRKRDHKYANRNAVDVGSLNVYSIPSGKYKLVLSIRDTLGNQIARSEKTVYLYNSQINNEAAISIAAKNTDFTGLTNDELEDEFKKAHYIATSDEIRTFSKLSSIEARRDFLAAFWKDVETGGRKERSDLMRAAYLDRVNTASHRYKAMGREGWKTDRGRVFILYGQPDEIQRFPSSDNAKPYEIWNYYQIENGVVFVFIDRMGLGDLSLVHSTKHGELKDDNWERYLQ